MTGNAETSDIRTGMQIKTESDFFLNNSIGSFSFLINLFIFWLLYFSNLCHSH